MNGWFEVCHGQISAEDSRKEAHVKRSLALGFAAMVAAVATGRGLDALAWAPTPRLSATSSDQERRDQPVTPDDLRILTKAAELLKDESAWNRADDRECTDDEATGKRSLFCALQRACIEVLGKYDHRRVALQEVRFAVEDATRGRDFEHRLRDFNNLPTTRLADIQAVLKVAMDRVRSRLKTK
jgi:hypothetical protein